MTAADTNPPSDTTPDAAAAQRSWRPAPSSVSVGVVVGTVLACCGLLLTGTLAYLALISNSVGILDGVFDLFNWFVGLSWLAQLGVVVGLGMPSAALFGGLLLYQVTRD